MNITIEYPWWYLFLCLFIGASYSSILYFNNKKNQDLSTLLARFLFLLRLLFVSLIAFFLLSPLLESTYQITEKPIIILAQDNSSSVRLRTDSLYYSGDYKGQLQDLIETLEKKHEVHSYKIGEHTSCLLYTSPSPRDPE